MERRMITMWVAAVATAVLAACGSAPEEPEVAGATASEPEQEAPAEVADGEEPDNPGEDGPERETEPDDPGEGARGAEPTQDGDDGETPWQLLPEDDRPELPVEQVECERTSPTPVAC